MWQSNVPIQLLSTLRGKNGVTMSESLFKPGDRLVVEIAEVYCTTRSDYSSRGRKSEEYVYRLKGDIPLMRERQLKLLERIK